MLKKWQALGSSKPNFFIHFCWMKYYAIICFFQSWWLRSVNRRNIRSPKQWNTFYRASSLMIVTGSYFWQTYFLIFFVTTTSKWFRSWNILLMRGLKWVSRTLAQANLISLFPLIFLSKHISLYALDCRQAKSEF